MFEDESLIILKFLAKPFKEDGNSCSNMHRVPKVRPPPLQKK